MGQEGDTHRLSQAGLCRRGHRAPPVPVCLSSPRSVPWSPGNLLGHTPGPGRGGDWQACLRFELWDSQAQGKVLPGDRGGARGVRRGDQRGRFEWHRGRGSSSPRECSGIPVEPANPATSGMNAVYLYRGGKIFRSLMNSLVQCPAHGKCSKRVSNYQP